MDHDCYLFRSKKGIVSIGPNEEHPWRWELRIAGRLIYPDYTSPEEAALRASNRDFGDEELNQIFVGLRVPSELHAWERSTPFQLRRSML